MGDLDKVLYIPDTEQVKLEIFIQFKTIANAARSLLFYLFISFSTSVHIMMNAPAPWRSFETVGRWR